MGSYATLKFGELDIASSKSVILDLFVCLFAESERSTVSIDEDPDEPIEDIVYTTPVSKSLKRLELLGVTKVAATAEFERWRKEEIEFLKVMQLDNGGDGGS